MGIIDATPPTVVISYYNADSTSTIGTGSNGRPPTVYYYSCNSSFDKSYADEEIRMRLARARWQNFIHPQLPWWDRRVKDQHGLSWSGSRQNFDRVIPGPRAVMKKPLNRVQRDCRNLMKQMRAPARPLRAY